MIAEHSVEGNADLLAVLRYLLEISGAGTSEHLPRRYIAAENDRIEPAFLVGLIYLRAEPGRRYEAEFAVKIGEEEQPESAAFSGSILIRQGYISHIQYVRFGQGPYSDEDYDRSNYNKNNI